eukprot:683379-Rhodomonas_salina.1
MIYNASAEGAEGDSRVPGYPGTRVGIPTEPRVPGRNSCAYTYRVPGTRFAYPGRLRKRNDSNHGTSTFRLGITINSLEAEVGTNKARNGKRI